MYSSSIVTELFNFLLSKTDNKNGNEDVPKLFLILSLN